MPGYLDRLVARMGTQVDMTAAPEREVDTAPVPPVPADDIFDPFESALDEEIPSPSPTSRPVAAPAPNDAQPPVVPPSVEIFNDVVHVAPSDATPISAPIPRAESFEMETDASTKTDDLPEISQFAASNPAEITPVIHTPVFETVDILPTVAPLASPTEADVGVPPTPQFSENADEYTMPSFSEPEPPPAPSAFDLAALMRALYPRQPDMPEFTPAPLAEAVPAPAALPDTPRVTIGEIRVEIVQEREKPSRPAPVPHASLPAAPRPGVRSKRGYGLGQS